MRNSEQYELNRSSNANQRHWIRESHRRIKSLK